MSPSRLIFGSCNSQLHKEQPLWPVIEKRNAAAFVWGGDAVYADDRIDPESTPFFRRHLDGSPDYLKTLYDQQRAEPGYRSLLETGISIVGTIDDHDYGVNNGDKTFHWRRENGMEFVRFLDLPEKNSAMVRRAEQGHGVYGVHVYDFGKEGQDRWLSDQEAGLDPDVLPVPNDRDDLDENNRKVAVFLLDVRSNKTPWIKSFPKRLTTDVDGDFLGERQWEWFQTAIGRSDAVANIVVTGIQVHAERFYDSSAVENWGGFPTSQHRLYQALLQPNVQAPILISGDVHKAQLLRRDCKPPDANQFDKKIRPLYEITTSGMTHAWGSAKPSTCGRANNLICQTYYFQAIYRPIMSLAHWISPWTELLVDDETRLPQYSLERNVAELEMDWDLNLVNVTILGIDDKVLVQQSWSMDQLTKMPLETSMVKDAEFTQARKRLEDLSIMENHVDDWVCVHHRGLPGQLHFGAALFLTLSLLMTCAFLPLVLSCFAAKLCLVRMTKRVRDKQD